MKLNQLAKASKVFEQIHALDAEVIDLERMAMLAANGEINTRLMLEITDLTKVPVEKETGIDEMRGLLYREMTRSILSYGMCSTPEPKKNEAEHTLKSEPSEALTLKILGVLLADKIATRENLIQELRALTHS